MESTPYDFVDNLIGLLGAPRRLHELNSSTWSNLADEHASNRLNIQLCLEVSETEIGLSYTRHNSGFRPFSELAGVDKRFLRCDCLVIADTNQIHDIISDRAKIDKARECFSRIFNPKTLPCMNLDISCSTANFAVHEAFFDAIKEKLMLGEGFTSKWSPAAEKFLIRHLKQFSKIDLSEKWPQTIVSVLKNAILGHKCKFLETWASNLLFDFAFFEDLVKNWKANKSRRTLDITVKVDFEWTKLEQLRSLQGNQFKWNAVICSYRGVNFQSIHFRSCTKPLELQLDN
ncbi:hypothetical protein L596_019805 [Steinernema carpocapsae]|uniref:Uncharacterized protein n=1 Tax=Steinernema carpocapsae TaxID=34508 RepID=A0A4U5MRM4_STECR|nr:hypothetical protein L596_019805 [Steinernema carpocapsae]